MGASSSKKAKRKAKLLAIPASDRVFAHYDFHVDYTCSPNVSCKYHTKLMYLVLNVNTLKIPVQTDAQLADTTGKLLTSTSYHLLDIRQMISDYIRMNPQEINAKNEKGWTVLMIAVVNCKKLGLLDIIKLLVHYGADVDAQNNAGKTALMLSVSTTVSDSEINAVKILLDTGASTEITDNTNITALCYAVRSDTDVNIIKLLVRSHCNLEAIDLSGNTILMQAVLQSNGKYGVDLVQFLLESGADANACNHKGWTALMCAARYTNADSDKGNSNIQIVHLLLSYRARVDAQNNYGYTAILLACADNRLERNIEVIKLLISYGANPDIKNGSDQNFWQLVELNSKADIIHQMLRQYRSDVLMSVPLAPRMIGYPTEYPSLL